MKLLLNLFGTLLLATSVSGVRQSVHKRGLVLSGSFAQAMATIGLDVEEDERVVIGGNPIIHNMQADLAELLGLLTEEEVVEKYFPKVLHANTVDMIKSISERYFQFAATLEKMFLPSDRPEIARSEHIADIIEWLSTNRVDAMILPNLLFNISAGLRSLSDLQNTKYQTNYKNGLKRAFREYGEDHCITMATHYKKSLVNLMEELGNLPLLKIEDWKDGGVTYSVFKNLKEGREGLEKLLESVKAVTRRCVKIGLLNMRHTDEHKIMINSFPKNGTIFDTEQTDDFSTLMGDLEIFQDPKTYKDDTYKSQQLYKMCQLIGKDCRNLLHKISIRPIHKAGKRMITKALQKYSKDPTMAMDIREITDSFGCELVTNDMNHHFLVLKTLIEKYSGEGDIKRIKVNGETHTWKIRIQRIKLNLSKLKSDQLLTGYMDDKIIFEAKHMESERVIRIEAIIMPKEMKELKADSHIVYDMFRECGALVIETISSVVSKEVVAIFTAESHARDFMRVISDSSDEDKFTKSRSDPGRSQYDSDESDFEKQTNADFAKGKSARVRTVQPQNLRRNRTQFRIKKTIQKSDQGFANFMRREYVIDTAEINTCINDRLKNRLHYDSKAAIQQRSTNFEGMSPKAKKALEKRLAAVLAK